MRCSTVRSLLDDHLDGLLPAERSIEIRTHLDSCAACDEEAELVRCVTAPLSAWGDLEPPAGCFDRILERIEALPPEMHVPAPPAPAPAGFGSLRRLRGGARWFLTSGAAAAAVLLAAAAVEHAADFGGPDRVRDRTMNASAAMAALGGPMGFGEIALSGTRFLVTDDLEQRDGLRRRPRADVLPDGPALEPAVPARNDPFGASPR